MKRIPVYDAEYTYFGNYSEGLTFDCVGYARSSDGLVISTLTPKSLAGYVLAPDSAEMAVDWRGEQSICICGYVYEAHVAIAIAQGGCDDELGWEAA